MVCTCVTRGMVAGELETPTHSASVCALFYCSYHEQFFAPSAYGWERLVGKIDTEVHAKRGREQARPAPPCAGG